MKDHLERIYLSVVILCYKEGSFIISQVESLYRQLSFFNFPWEIILVSNQFEGEEEDETTRLVKELEKQFPNVHAVTLKKQGMYGWDMKSGIEKSSGEYIAVIDGDGQAPLESIAISVLKMEEKQLDLLQAYRVKRLDGIYRKIITKIYNFIFHLLFRSKLHDINAMPKVFRKEKIRELKLNSEDWFIHAEIAIKAEKLGLKISEIPIEPYPNTRRKSFVKSSDVIKFFIDLLRYRFQKNHTEQNPTA